MEKFILIFIGLVLLKCTYNFYYFLLSLKYRNKYLEYLNEQTGRQANYINGHRQKIITILSKAGIEDTTIALAQPVGYGQLATGNASVFENMANLRVDVAGAMVNKVREAPYVYRSRMLEAFNPIYWIEFLIFLPRNTLGYLGVKPDTLLVRIGQLIWFLFGAASVVVGLLFNTEFINWLKSLS